jgi:ubiquinone/menaquinone biosynthesis C-methylase UbiE
MLGEAQAEAYARADFDEPNRRFCAELAARAPTPIAGTAVDLGCGPADIPLRLARSYPQLQLDAVDGSQPMLRWARSAIDAAGLGERVRVVHAALPHVPLPAASYDFVLSNSLLHHLHEPLELWRAVARLVRPGGFVQIMDLARPASTDQARILVEQYARSEPEVLKRDFYASLLAAFRPDEVRAQLQRTGLAQLQVEPISDRHLLVCGRC